MPDRANQRGTWLDPTNALQIANIKHILGATITRMLALEVAIGLLLGLGLLQRDHLSLGQHQVVLGALGLQRLEPLVHGREIVAQPPSMPSWQNPGMPD